MYFCQKFLPMKRKLFFFIFITSSIFAVLGQTRVETADYLLYIHKDSIKRTMQDLENFTIRYAPLGNWHIAEYIQKRLINYGITNAIIDTFYVEVEILFDNHSFFSNHCYNVRGSITGTQNPDSIVIIGAHLDAINLVRDTVWILNKDLAPGADDNASGIAVMIEMARIIHQYNLKPQNRIDLLAFDAEEIGLFGAAHDAQRRVTENDNVMIMINNDMVSYQPVELPYKMNIHWYDNATLEAFHAFILCAEYSSIIPNFPYGEDNNMRRASDSWEYAKKGIKSIFFIEHFFNPDYHTQYDLCENVNFEYIEEVAKVNFALLNHYAKFDNSTTEVQTVKNREFFSVYPNPVQKTASITISSFMHGKPYTFQVFDTHGRLCYKTSLTRQRTPIDFSEFSSGLYIMQLVTPDGCTYSQKIIK